MASDLKQRKTKNKDWHFSEAIKWRGKKIRGYSLNDSTSLFFVMFCFCFLIQRLLKQLSKLLKLEEASKKILKNNIAMLFLKS